MTKQEYEATIADLEARMATAEGELKIAKEKK